MTAVEFYAEQMQLKEQFTQEEFNNITNQAKEMEKQQIKAIWSASYENMRKTFGASNYTPIDFEEYYNENYN